MKKAALVTIALLTVSVLIVSGCSNKSLTTPDVVEEVNTCVSCHTDEDILQELATPEEVETSEATSGEG